LEKTAHKVASSSAAQGSELYRSLSEEYKLSSMMSGDAKLAVLYKDTLHQIKLEKEQDYSNLQRIHDQFD